MDDYINRIHRQGMGVGLCIHNWCLLELLRVVVSTLKFIFNWVIQNAGDMKKQLVCCCFPNRQPLAVHLCSIMLPWNKQQLLGFAPKFLNKNAKQICPIDSPSRFPIWEKNVFLSKSQGFFEPLPGIKITVPSSSERTFSAGSSWPEAWPMMASWKDKKRQHGPMFVQWLAATICILGVSIYMMRVSLCLRLYV